jgi:hypothetical protein
MGDYHTDIHCIEKNQKWKGAVHFHFKLPICDLWENGNIYDIDSCRDYICGLKH